MMTIRLAQFPGALFLASFCALWLSGRIGIRLRNDKRKVDEFEHADVSLIVASTLTLLGLIIGFTFSMSISRYEQRKLYEENEANAIGTEYLRADLLDNTDAQRLHTMLEVYLRQRISFYQLRNDGQLRQLDADGLKLQTELWSTVVAEASSNPSPLAALVASGMNDVFNSKGYTQASWWNRIPISAWALMGSIAICSHILLGYSILRGKDQSVAFLALILVVSLSFFLIADIDSPRRGMIRVRPENLISLSQSLHPQ